MPYVPPGSRPTEDQLQAFYRTPRWVRFSLRIRNRYGWVCMRCGATPPARIVTDHIKPLRYNWDSRLEPENMQVLCDPCNRWKGARAIDFRPRRTSGWLRRLLLG